MLMPKSTSMFPGSARGRPERCLQVLLNDIGDAGNLVVMSGSTVASTFYRGPESLPKSTDFLFATVSVITEREDILCLAPPMPAT